MSAEPGGPQGAGDDRSLKRFRAGLAFGFFNAMAWQIALGTPMVLFCERLGASTFEVGLAYAFVFLMTPLQVVSTAWIPRFGFKKVMLTGWALRSVFLTVPFFVAVAAPETGSRLLVVLLIGSVFFFCLFRAIGAAAWLPWLYTILPEGLRGRYFGTDQIVSGIAGVGTLVLCSLLFRLVPLYEAFRIEYLVAIGGSLLSFFALARLPDPKPRESIDLRSVVRETPRLLLRPGRYRQLVLIGIGFAVAVTPIPPFCAYYLKVGPGFSASGILLLTTLQYVGAIAGATLIRTRIDRLGPRRFFRAAMVVYMAVAAYWLLFLGGLAGGPVPLGCVYFLLGMGTSMWFSANLNYLPQVVEPGKRALMVSINSACISLSGGLSPILWGLYLREPGDLPSIDPTAFRVYFGFVLLAAIALFFVLNRLPSAVTWGRKRHPGLLVFRPFRAVTSLVGLGDPGMKRNGPDSTDE